MELGWYLGFGFRAAKKRLEVVGHIEILESDPKDTNGYAAWASIGEQVIYQREWDYQNKSGDAS